MSYVKNEWFDLPNRTTPITAERLNHLETQFDEAVAAGALGAVNVETYGAVLDGVTDDTEAWAAALAAVPEGGTIFIPRGWLTNTGSTPMVIDKGITLLGPGGVKVISTNIQGFMVTASNVTFDGVKFEGPNYTSYSGFSRALQVYGASAAAYVTHLVVRNCEFRNWRAAAMFATFVSDCSIENNLVDGCTYGGFVFLSPKRVQVNNNRIMNIVRPTAPTDVAYGVAFTTTGGSAVDAPRPEDCQANNNYLFNVNWEALETHGGNRITFANNVIVGCYQGVAVVSLPVSGSTDVGGRDVNITGNVIDSTFTDGSKGAAIVFKGGWDGAAVSEYGTGTIVGNTIRGHGGAEGNTIGAITWYYTRGVTVASNLIIDASGAGALCALNDNVGFNCTGNTVIDVWSETYAGIAAVNVRSFRNSGTVTGNNHFAGGKTATHLNLFGLRFSTTTDVDVVVGVNNFFAAGTKVLSGATVAKFAVLDGTPVVKPTVSGSRGANAALTSLLTALASQGIVTNSSSA